MMGAAPGYISSGYTCAGCGMFVTYGAIHSCGVAPQQPVDPTWPLINALQRVETELRRIADALEAKQWRDPGKHE
jgi:hypothetical protein